MKLLIVKLSAFGDIIHTLPAMHDLLQRPGVDEVHWLVDMRYAFVTQLFPPEIRVHLVALRGKAPLSSAWRVLRELRSERFDAVLDLQGLLKSALLARLSGRPVYGMDRAHLREAASRHLITPVPFHAEERHVVQMYRRVAAAPFGDQPAPLPYAPPAVPADAAALHGKAALPAGMPLPDAPYVWLHIGGGWATKQLPDGTWARLAQGLLEAGMTPLLGWGNAAELAVASGIARQVPGALLPPERLQMDALCKLLRGAAAVVGADTGVVHMAAALDTPTVSFWGPSASWRSAPLGKQHRHIESNPACGPCFKRQCDQFICMDMIRSDAIISAIHEVAVLP